MALSRCLLYTLLLYICYSFHTFNHYTFYYESHHYDFEPNQKNNSISIIDHYNNSIVFNSSFIITINNNLEIDYLNDNDWNEIYHHHQQHTNSIQHSIAIAPQRRRLWGWAKKKFKRVRALLRRLFGKVAIPPPRSRPFWNKKWIKKSRYIGYFPGYGSQKGLTYKKAEKYCDEQFGGLATIFSKQENRQVLQICRELLKKYKTKRSCKRKCKYILFRGNKCWTHCFIAKVEHLYAKKHWKGHNCWIGAQLGPSTEKSKAFAKWNDMKAVAFKNWSPGEPNYRRVKHCKKIWGTDGSDKQCEIETIYNEKCGEILAYNAGHAKVRRSKSQKKMFAGVPPDIQQQIAPKGYARQSAYALVPRAGKWNNARCKSSRVPICQKPRGQVYDQYIAVRAARSYSVAEQFCNDWYGATLATMKSEAENVRAMQACNAMDISKRSCWIGLQRPFKKWNDGSQSKGFTNWAPGEPNNAGYSENCVELYGGSGKWNDLGCGAKRYFLCNLQTRLQRMDGSLRKEMILKRLRRQKDEWKRHRRKEYRAKIAGKYRAKMAKSRQKQAKLVREFGRKQREGFRQNLFQRQYGGFMKQMGVVGMAGTGGLSALMRGRRHSGFRRRMVGVGQQSVDRIHAMNGNGMAPRKKMVELDMNMDAREMLDTFGVGYYEEVDGVDVKCKLFVGSGLYEMCIDENGIEVKKYLRKECGVDVLVVGDETKNVSNDYMNYMEYEDFKYKLAMKCEDNRAFDVDVDDIEDVDNYHLIVIEFVYDFDRNHNRQCLKYLYAFEVCLELDENENNKMVLEIRRPNKIVFASKLIKFYNDKEWNEINESYDEQNENIMVITKCIHMFDAKICIKCSNEIMNLSENDAMPLSLSYVANVFIHEHDHSFVH